MTRFKPGPATKQNDIRTTDDPELLQLERVTFGEKVITTDHANIHEGVAYSYPVKFTIAAGASAYLEILPPAWAFVHFKPVAIESDGPKILAQLIEAPTTTPGTPVTPVNRRRLGTPPAAATVIRINPTGVSGGTVLDQDYIGGGTGKGGTQTSGGNASNENEWVLNPGTLYLLKITNSGPNPADVNVKVFWYEELDG